MYVLNVAYANGNKSENKKILFVEEVLLYSIYDCWNLDCLLTYLTFF